MDLRLEPFKFSRRGRSFAIRTLRRSNFEDEVRLCGGPREQPFTITSGNMENTEASRFYLGLYPADSTPPDGLAPSHIRGRWDGRHSLALEADVHMRRGQSAISGGDDPNTGRPATLGMGRGGDAEFRALCARRLCAGSLERLDSIASAGWRRRASTLTVATRIETPARSDRSPVGLASADHGH